MGQSETNGTTAPTKQRGGQRCKVCAHERSKMLNKAIGLGRSLRSVALQADVAHTSVVRHTKNCLGLEVSAIIRENNRAAAIDVYEEFREQLTFAKRMRVAAEEYLSYPGDPLRMTLLPRADEIDVVYYDHADLDDKDKPVKKTATLAELVAMLEAGTDYVPGKVTLKHMDFRKLALDILDTTDKTIDKFAKLGGLYQDNRPNESDIAIVVKGLRKWYAEMPDAPEAEKDLWLKWFAEEGRIDPKELKRAVEVQELTEMVQ